MAVTLPDAVIVRVRLDTNTMLAISRAQQSG
jgi:hypothetical protein